MSGARGQADPQAGPQAGLQADLIVKHIGQLVTMRGPVPRVGAALADVGIVEDGMVVMRAGRIVAVGRTVELEREGYCAPEVIEAPGRTAVPGFVDAHTHLVFAGWRAGEFAARLRGESYEKVLASGGGILSTVRATRAAPAAELLALARERLESFLAAGTTTVEAKSGYGLNLDDELKCLRVLRELGAEGRCDVVPTFLGAHAVPPEFLGRSGEYVEFLCREVLPAVAREGLARFCDVFCERGAFDPAESRRVLEAARDLGLKLKIHADEFSDLGGARLAAELGATSADHLLQAGEGGLRAMARAGTVAVLLPGTALFAAGGRAADARRMIDLGLPVALGTDFNPGTCPVQSMGLMVGLACTMMRLTPEEALAAATVNAACAVGLPGTVGRIQVGFQADMVLLSAPSFEHIPYRFGEGLVETVIKRGRVVVAGGRPRR